MKSDLLPFTCGEAHSDAPGGDAPAHGEHGQPDADGAEEPHDGTHGDAHGADAGVPGGGNGGDAAEDKARTQEEDKAVHPPKS